MFLAQCISVYPARDISRCISRAKYTGSSHHYKSNHIFWYLIDWCRHSNIPGTMCIFLYDLSLCYERKLESPETIWFDVYFYFFVFVSACPDNCNACEWDSSTSSIICTDGQCDSKFGKLSDGSCSACPANCAVCSVSDASDADDTLFCDTCSDTYGLNSDVCASKYY